MSIKPTPKTKPIGYKQYAKSHAKKSPCLKNTLLAFLVGGAICTGGQGLFDLYEKVLHTSENDTGSLVSVTLIFLACFLTGVGIFDSIAKFAGAGTLVPITGFANSVISPAMDNKAEGLIMGVGSKMFIVAGPVIVYGTLFSVVYGIIYYLFTQVF
ncbi:MAG TPA: stage V sporulation protein AC [Clostridiales bacterium]|nr:stage V sporulation protein AC [Clostridiales bacterium]HCG36197.1 stage V sporulation protein AC [Clostridiales bacterium]